MPVTPSIHLPGPLTRDQWERIEAFLRTWKADVMAAARKHPARSFKLGQAQIEAFGALLTNVGAATIPGEPVPPMSPTSAAAQYWVERYTLRELDDSLDRYLGRIRDELLYGLRNGMNFAQVGERLFKATRDADVNWRMIARTEMVRANAAGRLIACQSMGYDRVWCPPHIGSCKQCKRLIERQHFDIAEVLDATNFGVTDPAKWVPCIPLHPHCRHAWVPYEPDLVAEANEHYDKLHAVGLDSEDRLDELFDSSGQLRDTATARAGLAQLQEIGPLFKSADPFNAALAAAVAKVRADGRVAKRARPRPGTVALHIADLRSDLLQRAVDPIKVNQIAASLRAAGRHEPILVSLRDDGTYWILGGQHRVLAAGQVGWLTINCDVRTGLSFEDEARLIREDNPHQPDPYNPGPTPTFPEARAPDEPPVLSTIPTTYEGEVTGRFANVEDQPDTIAALAKRLPRPTDVARDVWQALLRFYAHLCVTLGAGTALADVHDAWAAWTLLANRPSDNIKPFDQLPASVRAEDGPYADVVRAIAATAPAVVESQPEAIAKGFFDPEQEGLDPLLWTTDRKLRAEPRDRILTWWRHALGANAHTWSRLYLTGGSTSLQWAAVQHPELDPDVDVQIVVNYDGLRKHRAEWRKLNDADLHLALVTVVKHSLGDVDLVPGLHLDAFVRPEQTPAEFEADAQLAGQAVWDVHAERWIIAPVDQPRSIERYGEPWLEGVGAGAALAHPEWEQAALKIGVELGALIDGWSAANDSDTAAAARAKVVQAVIALHDARKASFKPGGGGNTGRGNFIWQWLWNYSCLAQAKALAHTGSLDLAKTWPDYAYTVPRSTEVAKMSPAPNSGVEHWITVHPNGPAEKGQPVLVRNNSDGSMSVIGGAGGHLNYLRLDPKHRITGTGGKEAADRDSLRAAGEPLSEAEQAEHAKRWEADRVKLQATVEESEDLKADLHKRISDYVASQVGAKWLTHGLVEHADGSTEEVELSKSEQRDALRRVMAGAKHALTYGQLSMDDSQASGYLVTSKHGDFEGIKDKPGDDGEADPSEKPDTLDAEEAAADTPPTDDSSVGEDLEKAAKRVGVKLPPLNVDHAQALMEMQAELRRVECVQAKARKALRSQGAHTDAMAMDWSDADIADDVKKKVEAQVRTDVARELLQQTEKNTYKVAYGKALHRGAYDTVDSVVHAVLGVSAITPELGRLLGPTGSAQLAVRAIRQYMSGKGLDVNSDEVLDALKELTDSQEGDVGSRALARARKAAEVGVQMRQEKKASQAGDSLYTETMARSYEIRKLNESAEQLGMAIGGMEALSNIKVALANPTADMTIGGFESPSDVTRLAQRAGLKIKASDIRRNGAGDYSLTVDPERLDSLVHFDRDPQTELRKRLRAIRTGKGAGMAREIRDAESTPGMAQELSPAQAQGKLFLLATGKQGGARHWNLTGTPIEKKREDLRAIGALGQVLDFAPGVGKTHTGIAAAMQLMHDEPDKNHRVLVVCPTTAQSTWQSTVERQGTKSCQTLSGAKRKRMADTPADFNVISFETLAKDPTIAHKLGATIIITDEAQKAKTEGKQANNALHRAGADTPLGPVERPDTMSRAAFEDKWKRLGESEHITREDKVRQFRESLDENLFHMSAEDAGNDLPDWDKPSGKTKGDAGDGYQTHQVELDPEHLAHLHGVVKQINDVRNEAMANGRPSPIAFGGRPILQKALYDRPGNAVAKGIADLAASWKPTEFEGFQGHPDHADGDSKGTYEPKGVCFSQFTTQLQHVLPELEAKGIKPFFAHGGMSNDQNDEVLKKFLAYKGKAMLVTSDKNATARSLQFGDNNGKFQHGATHVVHMSLPDNNATIQQREARIRRRGAQVGVGRHVMLANTPAELRTLDRLEAERRVQQSAGNSEQLVGGKETLRHILDRKGQKQAATLAGKQAA